MSLTGESRVPYSYYRQIDRLNRLIKVNAFIISMCEIAMAELTPEECEQLEITPEELRRFKEEESSLKASLWSLENVRL